MRVLIISHQFPNPLYGGGVYLFDLIRWLARDHEVFLLTRGRPEDARFLPRIQPYCREIAVFRSSDSPAGKLYNKIRYWHLHPANLFYWFEPRVADVANSLIHNHGIDIVQFEFTSSGQYLAHIDHRVKVLREHDVSFCTEAARLRVAKGLPGRLWHYCRYRAMLSFELDICRRADLVVALSEPDRAALQTRLPSLDVRVIPCGVDCSRFAGTRRPGQARSMLFVGNFRHRPNVDGMLYFARKVLPHILQREPSAVLNVVGANATDEIKRLATSTINLIGSVDDVSPLLATARVFVAPLTWGGGMKVKILEAMAAGVPVVTTSIGAYGIGLVPGEHALVADDPIGFADHTVEVLSNPELGRRLGEAGRAFVLSRFDWPVVMRSLNALYAALVEARGASTACQGPGASPG